LFVEVFVVFALHLAVSFGRDHGFGSHRFNALYDSIGIVALVGQHGLGLVLAQQRDGLGVVIHLAARDEKIQGQTQFIGEQVEAYIQQRQPKYYERAVILLIDLHDLSVRQENETGFQLTMEELRKTHAAKGAFLRRLAKANL